MYFYLDNSKQEIEHKPFICIYLLYIDKDTHTHTIIKCYTVDDKKVLDYLNKLALFDNTISKFLDYKVKRDGKIGLSFNKEKLN